MRVYTSFEEAMTEIQRDVSKGSPQTSTRVQNLGGEFDGRERISYNYGILEDFPQTPHDVVSLGKKLGLPYYQAHGDLITNWLEYEVDYRLNPEYQITERPNEVHHPALVKVKEGYHWSYTYTERLYGAIPVLAHQLQSNTDTRRAFWPIFQPQDAYRAVAPTRVPCSLGYQAMIREVPGQGHKLMLTYLQRSADFDVFFLTDVWLARKFQEALAEKVEFPVGMFIHYIISLHSFMVEGEEIY